MRFYTQFWSLALIPVAAALVLLVIPVVMRVRSDRWRWSQYRTAWLVTMFLLYPTITKQVVVVLRCSRDIDGSSYLEVRGLLLLLLLFSFLSPASPSL